MIKPSEQLELAAIKLSPKDLWKVVVALATAFTAVSVAGFAAGLKYQESQSNVTIAEAKGALAQSQAKLEVAQTRAEQLAAQVPHWQSRIQKLQSDITNQQQTAASLTAEVGRSHNCVFTREQIVMTQDLIERRASVLAYLNKEGQEMEKEYISLLQRRLEGHQQQLSNCK